MSNSIYHYVYRITNTLCKKHYYGVRSCKILPEHDLGIKYFSSSKDSDFLKDQKKNPQNYRYKIIKRFDNRIDASIFEAFLHEKFQVHINEKFYNMAKQNLNGFDTTGKSPTAEHRTKISNSLKGRPSPTKNKKLSEERKRKISNSLKGRKKTLETRKRMSESKKGKNNPNYGKIYTNEEKVNLKLSQSNRKWINNGKISKMIKESSPLPEGFVYGRLFTKDITNRYLDKKTKKKISNSAKNKRWITNGQITRRINKTEIIPEGFKLGRVLSS